MMSRAARTVLPVLTRCDDEAVSCDSRCESCHAFQSPFRSSLLFGLDAEHGRSRTRKLDSPFFVRYFPSSAKRAARVTVPV